MNNNKFPWRIEPPNRKDTYRVVAADGQTIMTFTSMDLDNATLIVNSVNAINGSKSDTPRLDLSKVKPFMWVCFDEDGDYETNAVNEFSGGRTNGMPLYLGESIKDAVK